MDGAYNFEDVIRILAGDVIIRNIIEARDRQILAYPRRSSVDILLAISSPGEVCTSRSLA